MNEEEIIDAAWYELLSGAEALLADWIDEDDLYGDDSKEIYAMQQRLMDALWGLDEEFVMGLTGQE